MSDSLDSQQENQRAMLNRIGQVTRTLHESLKDLGLDRIIEQAAKDIPDACERLHYVSRMTEQSAQRVLNATDVAIPIQTALVTQSQLLKKQWEHIVDRQSLRSDYNASVNETLTFLNSTEQHSLQTKALLMDIMMAQDFQDLTGQVIKKITEVTQNLEQQLLQVLIDFSPNLEAHAVTSTNNLINGPAVNSQTTDAYHTQQDVYDLLSDLGF